MTNTNSQLAVQFLVRYNKTILYHTRCIKSRWTYQYAQAKHITVRTPCAYQPDRLSGVSQGNAILGLVSRLICFQRLSSPHLATQRCLLVRQLVHQRCVHSGPLVLGADSLTFPCVHIGYKPNCLTRDIFKDCSCSLNFIPPLLMARTISSSFGQVAKQELTFYGFLVENPILC